MDFQPDSTADLRAARRNILAGTVGSVLEWYDFAVYGFLAPILGHLFFPSDDATASLLNAFGVFAIGYAARPLGGALFGQIGDRVGRKTSLIITMLAMGCGTTAIGLLPVHDRIGTAAAVLLVVLRLLQGLSVGGEYPGAIVFLAEHAPPARRGVHAAWTQLGTLGGFLLGSSVAALVTGILGEDVMRRWGWRVPFLLGSLIATGGIVFRRHMTEPPTFAQATRAGRWPVLVALRVHWPTILKIVGLLPVGAVGFYLVFVYADSYLTEQMHVRAAVALDINTVGLLTMLVCTMPAAWLSDRIGRKPVLYFLTVGTILLAWPLWWMMHQNDPWMILLGQCGFGVVFGAGFAAIPAVMVETLPAAVRCSGVSIAYNLALGLFGGTAPLVATALVARTGDPYTPAWYLIGMAVVSLLVVVRLRETARSPLP